MSISSAVRAVGDCGPVFVQGVKSAIEVGGPYLRFISPTITANTALQSFKQGIKGKLISVRDGVRKFEQEELKIGLTFSSVFNGVVESFKKNNLKIMYGMSMLGAAILGAKSVAARIGGKSVMHVSRLVSASSGCYLAASIINIIVKTKQVITAYGRMTKALARGDTEAAAIERKKMLWGIIEIVGELVCIAAYVAIIATTGAPPELWMSALLVAGSVIAIAGYWAAFRVDNKAKTSAAILEKQNAELRDGLTPQPGPVALRW